MNEKIVWKPSEELVEKTNIKRFMNKHGIESYEELIRRSTDDLEWFWDEVNKDLNIEWFKPYEKVLDLSRGLPWAKWFVGGKFNIVYNCVDKHVKTEKSDKLAYIWEGENGEVRKLSYRDLYVEVNRLANALKQLGIRKGDVVGIYMSILPEGIIAALACGKIGAIHTSIFSGFSTSALVTRLKNAKVKMLITADGYHRRGAKINLKETADGAADRVSTVKHIVVYRRLGNEIRWNKNRDLWYHEITVTQPTECQTEMMDSDAPLSILYTSGTTGKPKGVLLTHGGYAALSALQAAYLVDLKYGDILFWPSDMSWIVGQTWVMYGSLSQGGTAMIYEGAPDYPTPDRWWRIIEKHRVTLFGISPTGVRLAMKYGEEWVKKHDLSSLRLISATAEPLNPEPWLWLFKNIGGGRCPLINLAGGTEIGGAIVSPLPIMSLKPSTVGGPVPGIAADVADEDGKSVRLKPGHLVIRKPWPGMTQGLWNDPKRYIEVYWNRFGDVWDHGDLALIDKDGFWYVLGRVDDVIKVSGYRVGPTEIEAALSRHPAVAETAVVGKPHELKGEAIVAYVVLKHGIESRLDLKNELKEQVVEEVGKIARPEDIKFVQELPKTRTGKIVRRIIKAKFIGEKDLGDLSVLENPSAVEELDKAI
ncbi:MAG: acetate--CoA ligase [Candidatus Bathyarchaeota archaeon]